ncbi:2-C-methyl-D-erythritol 4-phosphate cytidylyltransferase [Buchnera aphidicola (Melanaphis sacchari)]|uniref:2-C-methyl-D-erythritol 4-phosphate cytidylyltransferase n=1 Tax=Buchnera aphidicola (Melanaphis sacchari) TaxID=2173854 RepID=A0A2U8DEW4_9GAMM|nr:2-C-methyl-D-erythritol 4-phosphate cytidylyltransferase [Buchnera aphidicola]AWH90380.1 2-C-methyl-D-erythritol 4-phosphate cytidylyltransferase [Buchnera aphidicola (Melanaphis sacchari)]
MRLIHSLKLNTIAIVPAAGIGRRMLLNFPKQYIKIRNKTIIEYTLETLLSHPNITRIIVSVHQEDIFFHKLPISSHFRVLSVIGGQKRIDSVLSGLAIAKEVDWIMIHDAVRPCLTYKDLDKLIDLAQKNKFGGILARPLYDTIKYVSKKNKKVLYTLPRKNLWRALTPQLFPIDLLRFCLQKIIKDKVDITDESSALEYCGYSPLIIMGGEENIKVTSPEDIFFVEYYLKKLFNT